MQRCTGKENLECSLLGILGLSTWPGNLLRLALNIAGSELRKRLGRTQIQRIPVLPLGIPTPPTQSDGFLLEIFWFQRRICLQFRSIGRLARKLPSGGSVAAFSVDCPYSLDDLKQPRSAGDSVGFQRRGNGQTDCLFSPAFVCDHKIGGHGIKIAIHALHRGIKGLQINGYVCAVGHQSSSLRFAALMIFRI